MSLGALAVSWHGYPRYSVDIDFFVRASEANALRGLRTLDEFGFRSSGLTIEVFTAPAQVVQLGHEPNRIDLMTSISGVSFEEAWEGEVSGELDGLPVHFIGREALMGNKEASGRNKDKNDLAELQKQGRKG